MFDFLTEAEKLQAVARLQHHPRVRRLVSLKSKYEVIKQRTLARKARHEARKVSR